MSLSSIPQTHLPELLEHESTSQLEIMRKGEDYLCMDPYLLRLRDRGQEILASMDEYRSDTNKRMEFMRKVCVFEELDKDEANSVYIMPGFTCEYWFNISFGKEIFIAHNCFIADVAPVSIGTKTMIGPNVQILTPTHPINPELRNGLQGPEAAGPITIGKNVWIGGGVIILSNVTIGDGCTVGAGSVVTKDVPPRTVVVGNPAKPVKRIELDGTVVDLRK